MNKTSNTRESMLDKLEESAKEVREFKNEYSGNSFAKRIKRLAKFKEKYLWVVLSQRGLVQNSLVHSKTFWGNEILIDLSDSVAAPIYYFGTLGLEELNLIEFLVRRLQKDSVFYDIGASYGFYSLLASEIIEEGEIHSFEPSDSIFEILSKQSYSCENIFLNKKAVSDTVGKLDFFDGSNHGDSEVSTTLEKTAEIQKDKNRSFERRKVSSITLNQYVEDGHTPPDFLKIDVEGAEHKVLRGGSKVIKEHLPSISLEVWEGRGNENIYQEAVSWLEDLGYSLIELGEEGELIQRNPKNWKDFVDTYFGNLLFINK